MDEPAYVGVVLHIDLDAPEETDPLDVVSVHGPYADMDEAAEVVELVAQSLGPDHDWHVTTLTR